MTHIATFSSAYPVLSLVLILPPRILDYSSGGRLFSSLERSARALFGSIFHRCQGDEATPALPFDLLFCTTPGYSAVDVKRLLLGYDGLRRPYFVLLNDSLHLRKVFKLLPTILDELGTELQ